MCFNILQSSLVKGYVSKQHLQQVQNVLDYQLNSICSLNERTLESMQQVFLSFWP